MAATRSLVEGAALGRTAVMVQRAFVAPLDRYFSSTGHSRANGYFTRLDRLRNHASQHNGKRWITTMVCRVPVYAGF